MAEPERRDADEPDDVEDEDDLDEEEEEGGGEAEQQELTGECPFCGTTGNIASSDWCEHWIGVDDLFKSSEPVCPITEGEPFDTFLNLIDILEGMAPAKRKRIVASAPEETSKLLAEALERQAMGDLAQSHRFRQRERLWGRARCLEGCPGSGLDRAEQKRGLRGAGGEGTRLSRDLSPTRAQPAPLP